MSSSASPFARLPALVEAAAREQAAAQEDTAAAAAGEEEEVYVLLDFSAAELPPGTEIRGDLAIEALDTAAPTIQLGEHLLRGTYDEDIGSTLVFDRSKLKRAAEAHDRALRDLVFEEANDEQPLVCVTTKRLRLRPAIETAAEAAGVTAGATAARVT